MRGKYVAFLLNHRSNDSVDWGGVISLLISGYLLRTFDGESEGSCLRERLMN